MRRRLPVLLAVLAVLLTACGAGGGGGTPAEQLASAFQNLQGTSFAYDVALDIDNDVLSSAAADNPAVGQASLFAGSFAMSGVYNGGNSSFNVGVMGSDAFDMRLIDDASKVYVRLGIVDLLAGFGVNPDDLLSELDTQGLPAGLEPLVAGVMSGEWIGFENDQEAMAAALPEDYYEQFGDPAELQAAFKKLADRFADPAGMLDEFTTATEVDEVDGLQTFAVDIKLRSALGSLAADFMEGMQAADSKALSDLEADMGDFDAQLQEGLTQVPETVPGLTVGIKDGFVQKITFDVGVAAASMGETSIGPGSALVVITVSREDVPTVEEPTTDNFFTSEQLAELYKGAAEAGV